MSKPLTIEDIARELEARRYSIAIPIRRPELWRPGIGDRVRGRLTPQGVRPSNGFEWLDTVMQRGIGSTAYELLWDVLGMERLVETGRAERDTSRVHALVVAPGSTVMRGGLPHFTCVQTTPGYRRAFLVDRPTLLSLLSPGDRLVWVCGTNM